MSDTIIQQYVRMDASCDDWDPRAPAVAERVTALLRARLPWVQAEHVGSSAVPGCAGKGIIDLQVSAGQDQMQPVKDTLDELGFQRQFFGMVWPEERPMRVGAIEHDGTFFRLHVHVVPEDDPDLDVMPRFRDALRADDGLRDTYVDWKRAIIASGQSQADEYTVAKGRWIEQVLAGQRPDAASVSMKDEGHVMDEHTRPLKIGFGLPDAEGTMGGGTARWSDLAAMARLAEDVGFDSLWVQDHLLFRLPDQQQETEGPWESFSLLAALAAITTRVELGTLVTCTSFRNPALTAKIADTIDEISGGRVILGLGAGWHEPEYRAFDFPFDHRVSRFEEALAIIAGLLRDGAIDYEGRFYSARDCELRPRGPRPRGLPLMLGSTSPRMLGLAARYADSWNAYFSRTGNRAAGVPEVRDIVDAACVEQGRDPATLERTVAVFVDFTGTAGGSSSLNPSGAPALTGSVDDMAEEMRAYAREGISHVQVHIDPATPAGIEQFARVLEQVDRG